MKKLAILFALIVCMAFFVGCTDDDDKDDKKDEKEYITFKKFMINYEMDEYENGSIEYIEDTFSGIWYNETTKYTYMTFESFDDHRTAPWGYDAGHPEDITDEFSTGDTVRCTVEMEELEQEDGSIELVGHYISIELVD